MKILLATGIYPPDIGGPATYAILVKSELEKRGHRVFVLPFRVVKKYPPVIRHFLYGVIAFWRAVSADLVLAQDTVSVGFPALLAAKITNTPIVVRVPGDFAWEQGVQRYGVQESIDEFQNNHYGFRVELLRFIQTWVTRCADFVIAPSDYFKKIVSGWGVKPLHIQRIYNGVSIPQDLPKKEFSRPTIVTAGRLVPWKGFDMLIRQSKDIHADIVIIGEGEDRARLEHLVQEQGVSERVSFMGSLSREELLGTIAGATLFVLPSSFESFSFQLVEAMMVGTPVVAFRIGNLDEIIRHGESGFLVEKHDAHSLGLVLNTLVHDSDLRNRIAKNAIHDAKMFRVEATVDQLEEVFKKVI